MRDKDNKGIVTRMLRFLKPYRLRLFIIFLASFISIPLGLIGPILIGQAIDLAVGKGRVDFDSILIIILQMVGCVALSALLNWMAQAMSRTVSALVSKDMRDQAFVHINTAPVSKIDTGNQGDLASRLVNDADAVSEGLFQSIAQLIPGIVSILATLIVMCMINLPIAVIVIVVTPLSIVFTKVVGGRTGKYFREQAKVQGDLSGYVNEMVSNQQLLQSLGHEDETVEHFSGLVDEYYDSNFKATYYSSIINPGTRFVNSIVYMAVGVFGAFYAVAGGISIGSLSAFLNYANQYTKPFNEVTAVLTQIQSAIYGAQRLFELIDWEAEIPDSPNAVEAQNIKGSVNAQNVYFSYDPEKPLIRDLNFKAEPGQRIALVGPTGCGKTTLINLLMRFYDIDSGSITLDGCSIRDMKRDSLRSLFGMVLQETWLKEATVHENIAYAKPEASRQEVEKAAKIAYAHSFIKRLPDGYDTVISSGGSNLSAGQRQLLCIARIVLADPEMFILDEATSSIDTRTEIAIQKALEDLMKGRTSFIVAHRLSTIQNADMIMVMRDGILVERGTHEELLLKGGFYSEIFESQFERV